MLSDGCFPKFLDCDVVEWLVSNKFLFSDDISRREAALTILQSTAQRSPDAFTRDVMGSCISDIERRIDSRSVFRRDDRADCSTEASLGYPDAEGWGSLETSAKFLNLILSCKSCMDSFVINETEIIVNKLVNHTNRFVREQGQLCLAELLRGGGSELDHANFYRYASLVRIGLQDNWSQVRYASLTATRSLFRQALGRNFQHLVIETIVPLVILNRHFVAEGVRRFAQDTWVLFVGPQGGKKLVADALPNVIRTLRASVDSENHSVREAAVSCLFEILSKVIFDGKSGSLITSDISAVLSIVISALEDVSWPVREQGGTCCLELFRNILPRLSDQGSEVLFAKIDYIIDLLFPDVFDSMLPLRQSSSECLGYLVALHTTRFSNHKFWSDILCFIPEKLLLYSLETTENDKTSIAGGRSGFFEGHENRPMYSCGTLTTGRAVRKVWNSMSDDCCSGGHCTVPVNSQYWEIADGAFRLYGSLIESQLLSSSQILDLNNACFPAIASVLTNEKKRKFSVILDTASKVVDFGTLGISDVSEDVAAAVSIIAQKLQPETRVY